MVFLAEIEPLRITKKAIHYVSELGLQVKIFTPVILAEIRPLTVAKELKLYRWNSASVLRQSPVVNRLGYKNYFRVIYFIKEN